ncbi:MAG: RnfABCDGE type electron transport complex subunit G [Spirochaetota bacterium]
MKHRIKMLLVLTFFACVSGLVLSGIYMFAHPLIQQNLQQELRRSIFQVVPGVEDYQKKQEGGVTYYVCRDASGTTVGYAVPAEGNGYQGKIRVMIGLSPDLEKITGMRVLEQKETPGLGGRISEKSFQKQFEGMAAQPRVGYVKNKRPEKPNNIQAITGATISSRSVVAVVNKGVKNVEKVLKKTGGG